LPFCWVYFCVRTRLRLRLVYHSCRILRSRTFFYRFTHSHTPYGWFVPHLTHCAGYLLPLRVTLRFWLPRICHGLLRFALTLPFYRCAGYTLLTRTLGCHHRITATALHSSGCLPVYHTRLLRFVHVRSTSYRFVCLRSLRYTITVRTAYRDSPRTRAFGFCTISFCVLRLVWF